jgi:transcriptional regulator with XRE-family HTH domain
LAKGIHNERYARLMAKLAGARRDAGLSQAEVAERLGHRQQYVSKYESGERRLDVIEFLDAAEALGLDGISMLQQLRQR